MCIFTGNLLCPRSFFILVSRRLWPQHFESSVYFLDGGIRDKQKCEDFYSVANLSIQFMGYSQTPFFNTVLFICVR